MSEQNPVNELIKIAKQNQELLAKIAVSQEQILEISKSQRNQERWKMVFEIGKLVIWPVVILIGFIALKEMMISLIPSVDILSNFTGNNNNTSGAAGGINELLKLLGQ